MKVSRVVLIVVALHVLVIGGIFVFEGCSRSQAPTPDMAANESLPGDQPAAAPSQQTVSTMTPAVPTPQVITPSTGIPASAPVTAAVPQPTTTTRTHVVKKGDSLWKIAKLEGISVGELTRANNLTKSSTLKIGQKLQIPQSAKAEKVATASVIPTGSSTPSADAVPASDVSGTMYTVKSGDSLWKIARQQNVSVAAIKQANSLSSDSLKVGQKLHMPAASAASAASTTAPATVNAGIATPSHATDWREPGQYTENGQTIHIVDFNESPATIAKKYGIKTDDLMKANNITNATKIQYGQRLVIPLPGQAQPMQQTSAATAPVSAMPAVSSGTIQPTLAAPVVSASKATIQ